MQVAKYDSRDWNALPKLDGLIRCENCGTTYAIAAHPTAEISYVPASLTDKMEEYGCCSRPQCLWFNADWVVTGKDLYNVV